MKISVIKPAVLIVTILAATTSFATDDPMDSDPTYGTSRNTNPSYSNGTQKRFGKRDDKTDLLFEKGKKIYRRERSKNGKFKYCVFSSGDDEYVGVKAKSLKPYDGSTYDEMAKNIRNCDNPDESLAESFDKYDAIAVLYYLKKQYKISLTKP